MKTIELNDTQYMTLVTRLEAAGMPPIPEQFSIAHVAQVIPHDLLDEIEAFIGTFDKVTTRTAWCDSVLRDAPDIARSPRKEVCFFSAWDFHFPPETPEDWQLIEFNDNGSGFLFAGLFNRLFCEVADPNREGAIECETDFDSLARRLRRMVESEARTFFGRMPGGLFLILDDATSLRDGRFRQEHVLLRDLFCEWGLRADICAPEDLIWTGQALCYEGGPISFIVNRSTDFFWQSDTFDALIRAYTKGEVYVAPNPFTYATRSDKRILQFLSGPADDHALGISAEERALLSAHIPSTRVITHENAAEAARHRDELVFKPAHGFAGRGLLDSSQIGANRLHRLLKKGQRYVAQAKVPKSQIRVTVAGGQRLWLDLRVWAYRGKIFLQTGRASSHPERLVLRPPGGWLATLVGGKAN